MKSRLCSTIFLTLPAAALWNPAKRFSYDNRTNYVSPNDGINRVHAGNHVPKNSVASVEMWLGRMSHKPLRPARVLARKRHAYRTAFVRDFVYFAANLIIGPTISIAPRVAILDYEVGNYA